MRGWIKTAAISAVLGAMVILLVAPAQASGYGNLVEKKRYARSEYRHWDSKYMDYQHRLNDLYSRRDHVPYHSRRWHKLTHRIERLEGKTHYAGEQSRRWHRRYKRYSRKLYEYRHYRKHHYGNHRRPMYYEPWNKHPRRHHGYKGRYRKHRHYRGGVGIGFYNGHSGFKFFIGGH